MGAVSPIGNDLPTIWDNLMKGYCGIDFIKSFDTADLPVKIAAELKDFNPEACGVDKAFVKRNDRFAVYSCHTHGIGSSQRVREKSLKAASCK